MSVLMQTSFGDIVIDLQTDKFPTACYNFLKLCKLKCYNNALFMNVQKDFVTEVRTKKPTTIWQCLGEDKPFFKDQVDLEAKVCGLGLIGTSNTGPNLNNSQFFLTLTKSHLSSLNGKHTVFGKVEEGFEVLKRINETYVDDKGRPQMNIRILHTFVLDDPFEDPPKLKEPPSPKLEKDPHRLEAVEHLEMLEKYSTEKDIIDATRKQKAKKQAMTLQMIGELPDASIKPPENILFVCKLNPITQQRDLELIFSRFGPIKSVEVVRDWKTGQSLQYGFIQFESSKSCEQAYLKMDNVTIDDRRIKVDFSQSVSKLMPRMKSNQAKTYKAGGESKEGGKELVSRMRNQKNYYGDKKYDIVAKDTNPKPRYGGPPEIEEVVHKSRPENMEMSQEERQEERSQQKSPSRSKQKSKKRQKQRQRSKSRSPANKKSKKQKKDRKQKKQKKQKSKRKRSMSSERRSLSSRSRSRSRDRNRKKKQKSARSPK